MVRKAQFSREDVVAAAYALVKKEGIEQLTARNVAQVLGSSTAPVYSNFENMEQLEEAAFEVAAARLLEFALQDHTDNPFLNMGIGVLRFARECPQWYFAFSIRNGPGQPQLQRIIDSLLEVLADIPGMEKLLPLERKLLLRKMGIFTHGLASEICAWQVEEEDMKDFIRLLGEVGDALRTDALACSPRNEEELEHLATLCHERMKPNEDFGRHPRQAIGKDEDHEN